MTGNLFVQTDGLRTFSQTHADIASGLSQLTSAAAPAVAGVETSHGPIASAVSAALGELLGARQGTIQTTAASGNTISELLQKAAQAYEQGDQKGAETLRAAVEAMDDANSANAPGGSSAVGIPTAAAASAPAADAGGAGSQMMGQMLGQLGQVGQWDKSGRWPRRRAAPLQALAQPLQQVPQQVMQGVQQASQAGGDLKMPGDPKVPSQGDPTAPEQDSRGPAHDEQQHRAESAQRAEAAPGESAGTGRAPELPRAERAEPAQTRPQSD